MNEGTVLVPERFMRQMALAGGSSAQAFIPGSLGISRIQAGWLDRRRSRPAAAGNSFNSRKCRG